MAHKGALCLVEMARCGQRDVAAIVAGEHKYLVVETCGRLSQFLG